MNSSSGGTITINDGTLTAGGNSDINGTVTLSTGTYDANGSFDATGGTLTFSDAANLELADAVTSLGEMTSTLGTVTYNGTDQTIFGDTYNHLTLTGGTKTLGAAIVGCENLTIAASTTLNAAAGNFGITLSGNWANSGTFTAQNGTVTFTGTAAQTLAPGTGAFYNFIINKAGLGLTPSANLDVDHAFTLTDGTLDLLTNNVDVNIGYDLLIQSGAVWTKGSGTTTFDGTSQTLTDNNATPNNLGIVVVD